jgi:class 3 adenylate cyclase
LQREIQRFRGETARTEWGDVFLFDGPARAIRCAHAVIGLARRHGARARAGLHTGECDRAKDGSVAGVAVEIACQVLDAAAPDEVLVSSTVRDLVAGSGIAFSSSPERRVVTAHGEWSLCRAGTA